MAFRSIVNSAANDDTSIHLECRRQQPFLLFSHSRSLSLSVTGHLSLSIFYKILLNTERVYAEAAAAKSGRKIAAEKKEWTMCLEKKRDESIDFALCSFAHVENAVNVATREEKNTRTGATTTGKNKEKKIVSKLLFNLKIRKLRRVLHNNCVGTFVCICAQQRWM